MITLNTLMSFNEYLDVRGLLNIFFIELLLWNVTAKHKLLSCH